MKNKNSDFFSENQVDKLLNQIISDSRSKQSGMFMKRYFFKTAVIVCGTILFLLFFIPGTVVPAPISDISAAPIADSGSATVNFRINSLVPLREISAVLNNKPVEVLQESYQGYSVEVEENGYLLLEVETVTGMTSSQNILIDSLDDEVPQIVKHEKSGDGIIIYLSDGDGSGIDYANITAYYQETAQPVLPTAFSETKGYVVFEYPKAAIYIEIPDKAGNKITSILKPVQDE